jgi:ureidoglycolate hydrolase
MQGSCDLGDSRADRIPANLAAMLPKDLLRRSTTSRFHDLVQIDVADGHGRPLVSLLRGQPRQFPSRQESLERHPLVRRSFRFRRIPTWFLVAPRGEFNPQALCAFLAHAGQGVNYAKISLASLISRALGSE